jgi:hypothetical protein
VFEGRVRNLPSIFLYPIPEGRIIFQAMLSYGQELYIDFQNDALSVPPFIPEATGRSLKLG